MRRPEINLTPEGDSPQENRLPAIWVGFFGSETGSVTFLLLSRRYILPLPGISPDAFSPEN